jgi:hypothetical protein
VGGGGRN